MTQTKGHPLIPCGCQGLFRWGYTGMNQIKSSFVGRISTSKEASNAAFQVKVYVLEDRFDIVSVDGEEWTWPMDDVSISRVAVGRYELQLGDERLYFLPVDTKGFQHHVVDAGVRPGKPEPGWLRRRIEAAQATDEMPMGYDLEVELDEAPIAPQGRRRHEHEWITGSAVGVITRRCTTCNQVSIDARGVVSHLAGPVQPDDETVRVELEEALSSLHAQGEPELVGAPDPLRHG